MSKSLKTFLIVIAIILVPVAGGLGYRYFTRKKSESNEEDPADNAGTATSPTSTTTSTTTKPKYDATKFPLKLNASVKSDLVKDCQELLNEQIEGCIPPVCPYYSGNQIKSLVCDGYYGNKTAAVVKFVFPETDGKTITEDMYNSLVGKRKSGTYLLF